MPTPDDVRRVVARQRPVLYSKIILRELDEGALLPNGYDMACCVIRPPQRGEKPGIYEIDHFKEDQHGSFIFPHGAPL